MELSPSWRARLQNLSTGSAYSHMEDRLPGLHDRASVPPVVVLCALLVHREVEVPYQLGDLELMDRRERKPGVVEMRVEQTPRRSGGIPERAAHRQ